jgi:hypothetical protein
VSTSRPAPLGVELRAGDYPMRAPALHRRDPPLPLTRRSWDDPTCRARTGTVATLNRKLRGWGNYFRYGSVLRTRHILDRFVCDRVRQFLVRRNKCPTRGTRRYRREYVFGELGVLSLSSLPRRSERECPL